MDLFYSTKVMNVTSYFSFLKKHKLRLLVPPSDLGPLNIRLEVVLKIFYYFFFIHYSIKSIFSKFFVKGVEHYRPFSLIILVQVIALFFVRVLLLLYNVNYWSCQVKILPSSAQAPAKLGWVAIFSANPTTPTHPQLPGKVFSQLSCIVKHSRQLK